MRPWRAWGWAALASVIGETLNALSAPIADHPEVFLYVFLPPLLFAGGLTVDVRRLFDDIAPVLVLAIIAVLLCMVAVGVTLYLVTGTALVLCLLLGAVVATTDTAAVLGIFRDIGAPSRLTVIVEGESLFNDAAAIALIFVLLGVLTGEAQASFFDGAMEFAKGFLGGMLLGYAMAWLCGYSDLAVARCGGDGDHNIGRSHLSDIRSGPGRVPCVGHHRGRDHGDGVCFRRAHAAVAGHVGDASDHVASA